MDEVVLPIRGQKHYLWRAVDQDVIVLDILVQSHRNKKAVKRFFRKLLKGVHYVLRLIFTDKLKSYEAAKREILPGVEHRQHKGLNNQAENSHQPTRLREKKMRHFKSGGHAQRFLSASGPIYGHFKPRRHRLSAGEYRAILQTRFQIWNEVTGMKLVGSLSRPLPLRMCGQTQSSSEPRQWSGAETCSKEQDEQSSIYAQPASDSQRKASSVTSGPLDSTAVLLYQTGLSMCSMRVRPVDIMLYLRTLLYQKTLVKKMVCNELLFPFCFC